MPMPDEPNDEPKQDEPKDKPKQDEGEPWRKPFEELKATVDGALAKLSAPPKKDKDEVLPKKVVEDVEPPKKEEPKEPKQEDPPPARPRGILHRVLFG